MTQDTKRIIHKHLNNIEAAIFIPCTQIQLPFRSQIKMAQWLSVYREAQTGLTTLKSQGEVKAMGLLRLSPPQPHLGVHWLEIATLMARRMEAKQYCSDLIATLLMLMCSNHTVQAKVSAVSLNRERGSGGLTQLGGGFLFHNGNHPTSLLFHIILHLDMWESGARAKQTVRAAAERAFQPPSKQTSPRQQASTGYMLRALRIAILFPNCRVRMTSDSIGKAVRIRAIYIQKVVSVETSPRAAWCTC